MKTRSSVILYGAYGGINGGDEAILYSLIRIIEKKDKIGRISVAGLRMAPSHRGWYQDLGVDFVPLRSWKLLKELRRSQLIVGGGQMLDGRPTSKGLAALVLLLGLNRLLGHRPMLVGIGAECIDQRRSKLLVRAILALVSDAACRDGYTTAQLAPLSSARAKVRETADIVFCGAISDLSDLKQTDVPCTTVLVCVFNSPSRSYGSPQFFLALVGALVDALPDHQVVVVAQDGRDDFDLGLAEWIVDNLPKGAAQFHQYRGLPELLELYSRSALVVSSRMHPIIFGFVLRKAVLAIADTNKLLSLAERLGIDYVKSADTPASIAERAVQVLSEPLASRDELLGGLRQLANSNVKGL